MAGVSTGGHANGGRRTVDREINMVPFIDLLMVTISFLLITAVWTRMGALPTTTNAPKPSCCKVEKDPTVLHVRVSEDRTAKLELVTGSKVDDLGTFAVDRLDEGATKAWHAGFARGVFASDGPPETAVLHVPAAMPLAKITSAIDALYAAKRSCGKAPCAPAFFVTFSST